MAINFPASPSTNDTHTENAITWVFNGTSWDAQDVPVTAASIGLGSVDNTSDADKPVSTAQERAIYFSTPKITSFIANIENRGMTSPSDNQLCIMSVGDSLGNAMGRWVQDMAAAKIGVAGLALRALSYSATSGTVNFPATNTQRRLDMWGTGYVIQMENGSVMEIGHPTILGQEPMVRCDAVSIYFGRESGGGTVDIDYTRDDGVTWTSLETGVSTDNPTIDILTKSYTFTNYDVRIRITVTSGNVEVIGAKIWNQEAKGLIYASSYTGSLTLAQYMSAPSSSFDSVMADLSPNGYLCQMSESSSNMNTHFSDFIDQITDYDSEADIVWVAEHPQTSGSTVDADVNEVARTKATTTHTLKIWEAPRYFGGFDGISARGWNSTDIIHLTQNWADDEDPAWRFQAALLVGCMIGDASSVNKMNWVGSAQTSTSESFLYRKELADVRQITQVDDDRLFEWRIKADDTTGGSLSYTENSWGFTRLPNTGTNSNGFRWAVADSGLTKYPLTWSEDGRSVFQRGSTVLDPDSTPYSIAVVSVRETSASKSSILGINTAADGKAFSAHDGTSENGNFRADGTVELRVFTVAALPSTGNAGRTAFVSDGSVVHAGNSGTIVAGSGANFLPVYDDGTNWRIT